MPVQKRSSENLQDDSHQHHRHHYQQQQEQVQHEDHKDENEEEQEGADFDRIPSSSSGEDEDDEDYDVDDDDDDDDDEEYLCVKLSDIRKEVQCPICLGIIRQTKTVMECLHRFCKECIDKSMRLGNNECPACRTHLASRRSLRADPNFDALIATLYPDIDQYEEKELAFSDEEKTRNKHIQESISQTLKRQSEALGRRCTTAKDVTSLTSKPQGNHRRGRRRKQATKVQGSEDDEDENDDSNGGGRDSSSSDEQRTEVKRKRHRRWAGRRASQPSSTSANANVVCNENNSLEVNKEGTDASPGVAGTPEVLTWGKGGTRSHTRHGTVSGGNARSTRSNNRLFKLVNYLRNLEENDDEV